MIQKKKNQYIYVSFIYKLIFKVGKGKFFVFFFYPLLLVK